MTVDREGRVRLASVTQVSPLRIQFRASNSDVPVTFSSVPGIQVGDQVFAATQRHRVLVLARASSPAGDNPFDTRYVNKAGDTVSVLTFDSSGSLRFDLIGPDGDRVSNFQIYNISGRRQTHWRSRTTAQSASSEVILYPSDDDSSLAGYVVISPDGGEVLVEGPFTATGAKNAQITKPHDPTRALRFAATESNTPGTMEVYCGVHTVPADRQLTLRPVDFVGLSDEVRLSDYIPIGRNPRVRLDSAGPREDSTPHAPYAWAEWDPADPRIEIRAPAGDYHVELRFIRADAEVEGWTHEVEVPPDDLEDEEL